MSFNITPSNYRDHHSLAHEMGNLWENNGWMVWDRTGGEDILLWASPYRLFGGQPGGPYALGDVALSQTLLVRAATPAPGQAAMRDNPFLCVGYDLGDHLPAQAIQVDIDASRARWQVGNRQVIARPPQWSLHGEHAGVGLDLSMQAMGPGFWFTDPQARVEETEEQWFVACARAKGVIDVQGERIPISGFASHERHVHCGVRYNPVKTLSARGVTWHGGGAGDTQIIFLSRPSLGLAWCRLVHQDQVLDFSAPEHRYAIDETEFWVDPQSRLQIPCAWRSTFEGPSGQVVVRARAHARAYYLWPHYKHGCTVLYWWLAQANVQIRARNGLSLEIEDMQYIVHDNRLLYRQHRND
ncbi:hypothetical protein [Variovorax sp. OV329]|uniref:hypothetical protein n=1 Tax=Variovorax sp. OV329 TaxID=1882825 RepID=UPI0008DED267|nr:hypothetical protein [Variovorax sp. OV329]SFN52526.1 hypothetical protein SAMN05444747_13323 [Variovorax sp. OV329]